MPETLRESILDFLNSASSPKQQENCRHCGLTLTHLNMAFFYKDQSWQVEVPVCSNCHPIQRIAGHDA